MLSHLRRINNKFALHPFKTAVAFCTVKAVSADAFTQKALEGKHEFDTDRLAVFCTFGFFYQGTFQYFLWNVVFESIWPGTALRACLSKVVATNLISDPVFFFPVFYTIREAFAAHSADVTVLVPAALAKYAQNYRTDWTMSWCAWVPGHCVTYFLMPIHLRVPWVATASFFYVCLLSYMRGDTFKDQKSTPEAKAPE